MRSFNPTNGEREFDGLIRAKFLESDEDQESLVYEPEAFSLTSYRSGPRAGAVRPDFRFSLGITRRSRLAIRLGLPIEEVPTTIYLELSSADRHSPEVRLPRRIRRRNKRSGRSGKECVTPDVYLGHKNDRLEIARQIHGIVILLLCWDNQLAIFRQPDKLEDMIAAELARRPRSPALTS